MRKITVPLTILLAIILIVGGTMYLNKSKENEMIFQKATIVGEDFFKEYYNIDVVFTRHDIKSGYTGSSIGLKGHVKNDPSENVFILIDYRDYSVVTEQVSEELYKKAFAR